MKLHRIRGRAGAVLSENPPSGGTVTITATDFLTTRLMSSEPTIAVYNQDFFTTSSYATDVAYQEAVIIKVAQWPVALSGRTILTAKLDLFRSDGYMAETGTLYLRRMLRNWVYTETTWERFAVGSNWQTAGALGASDVDLGTPPTSVALADSVASFSLPTSAAFVALVQGHKDGSIPNYGYLLHCSNMADYHQWRGPTGANPPVMTLTY